MGKRSIKRSLLLLASVVFIVQLACSLGAADNGETQPVDDAASPDYAATEQALKATQDALANQAQQPTREIVATTAVPPTQVPPTPVPPTPVPPTNTPVPTATQGVITYSSGDTIFFTDFDGVSDWDAEWVHFSIPDDAEYIAYKDDGVMHIEIPTTNTEVVVLYEPLYFESGSDVYVETSFQNMGTHNINNISVICRASEEGFYEFSMLSGGLWYIWYYDGATGNFRSLNDGGIADLDYDAPHTIGASCIGNSLTFYFDGEKVKNGTIKNSMLTEGWTGISVYAYEWKDVKVDFDYFGIMAP